MPEFRLGKHRGKYCVVWYDETGRQRRSLGTDDEPTARARLAEFQRQFTLIDLPDRLSLAEIYEAYAANREANGVRAMERIRDVWKALAPTFGALYPEHITESVAQEYAQNRLAAGRAVGTVHTELTYLRTALQWAAKRDLIAKAPYVWAPKKPPAKDRWLTRDEADRLIDAAVMPHVRLFIQLALYTAGRKEALLGLTWDRVNLQSGLINLRDPNREATKKGRSIVPIAEPLVAPLQDAWRGRTCNHVIEWGGQPVGDVKKGVAAASKRAGIECTPHVLRHTAATWMAMAGVPMQEISRFLGHTTTATTERVYAHHHPDYLRGAAAALAGSYEPVGQSAKKA